MVEATTGLTIRAARAEDADAIHEVFVSAIRSIDGSDYSPEQKAAWEKAVRPDSWATRMLEFEFKVAEFDGKTVGFASWSKTDLEHIYVASDSRRQGVGSTLMEAVLEHFGKQEVMLTASLNAVKFYAKYGFLEEMTLVKQREGVDIPCIRMKRPAV